jgi:hypothetical protein
MDSTTRRELEVQLGCLRSELLSDQARGFLDLFDDFMLHDEFGLALITVCDFLLEPNSPPVSKSVIDLIRHLQAVMHVDDSSVDLLNKKLR